MQLIFIFWMWISLFTFSHRFVIMQSLFFTLFCNKWHNILLEFLPNSNELCRYSWMTMMMMMMMKDRASNFHFGIQYFTLFIKEKSQLLRLTETQQWRYHEFEVKIVPNFVLLIAKWFCLRYFLHYINIKSNNDVKIEHVIKIRSE